MRIVIRIVGALVALVLVVFGLQYVASESGEVATIRTVDADGTPLETRIWVVDHEGAQWIRTGNAASKWMARVKASPEVEVVRNGASATYRPVLVPEARETVNGLMAEKYGWADAYIGMMFPRDDAQIVRLDPRPAAP